MVHTSCPLHCEDAGYYTMQNWPCGRNSEDDKEYRATDVLEMASRGTANTWLTDAKVGAQEACVLSLRLTLLRQRQMAILSTSKLLPSFFLPARALLADITLRPLFTKACHQKRHGFRCVLFTIDVSPSRRNVRTKCWIAFRSELLSYVIP